MDAPKMAIYIFILIVLTLFSYDVQQAGIVMEDTRNGVRANINNVLHAYKLEGVTRTQHVVKIDKEKLEENWPKWVDRNMGRRAQTHIELLSEDEPILAVRARTPVYSYSLSVMERKDTGFYVFEPVVGIWDEKQ